MTTIAMIPARMGSQRLKQKNLQEIRGIPLITHAIRKCKQVAAFDEIWVNAEHPTFGEIAMHDVVVEASGQGKKIIFAGNGASAAISSHCAVDYTKQAQVRAINFNEADLITCFANDYGYEHWVAKAIEHYSDPGDVVVLISSSGRSPNMVRAAEYSRQAGHIVVTFTGQAPDNPLKALGDINFWVDSKAYNIVENVHQIWLMMVCDLLIGRVEYTVS